nr:MAG TPA: Protein of unknown function (DUF2846) [Caudoviricetes sp.]
MRECIVELYREPNSLGSAICLSVVMSGQLVGSLSNGGVLRIPALPGQHLITFYKYGKPSKPYLVKIQEEQENAFFTVRIGKTGEVELWNGRRTSYVKKPTRKQNTALGIVLIVLGVLFALVNIFRII